MIPMLEDVPTELCGRSFRMDPLVDDVIRGSELQENMVVLVEDRDLRVATVTPEGTSPRVLDRNRWCVVTKLVKTDENISFVGIYCDGHKTFRDYDLETAWYVKYWSAPELLDERNLRCEQPMPQWERYLLEGRPASEPVREPAEGWT